MFEYTMLALKCLFGPYTRDLGVAVEKFGDFTYPNAYDLIREVSRIKVRGRKIIVA